MTPVTAESPEDGARHLRALEAVALDDSRSRPQRVLEVAREALKMEIAYFSEFTPSNQVIRAADGDGESFGLHADTAIPIEQTYCRRMVTGQVPNLVPDTHANPILKDLPATGDAGIRAYIGVPVQLSAGSVYGTLCCASHRPTDRLGDSDVRFLRVLARLLADELDRQDQLLRASVARPSDEDVSARLPVVRRRSASGARSPSGDREPGRTCPRGHPVPAQPARDRARHERRASCGYRSSELGRVGGYGRRSGHLRIGDRSGSGFEVDVGVPDPLDEGGRGRFLVEQIATRWGVENKGGTCVWFELSETPS